MPILSTCDKPNIPSFIATKSVLLASPKNCSKTRIAFTPIIPYPATDFDTILLQKGLESGPLWCDEGAYCIAEEIQLLNPDKFGNIYLGCGGFHLEKVVIACCGKYLVESGIDSIFVELEIFGFEFVTSVMAGGNYIRGKRGIALISEALQRLQFTEFIKTVDISRFSKLFGHIAELHTLFRTENRTPESIKSVWKCCQNEINEFNEAFSLFKDRCSEASEQFQYFNIFLEKIAPVLRGLTRSYRESNWELHLTALHRALPLCFQL